MKAREIFQAAQKQDASTVWGAIIETEGCAQEVEEATGSTLLHYAAKDGNLPMCQLLISKRAHVNAKDKVSQTPLHKAAYWGKLDVLEFLVFVGGDIKSIDSMGRTPAEVAFHRNNMPVFDFLENIQKSKMKLKDSKSVKRRYQELLQDQEKEAKLFAKDKKILAHLEKVTLKYEKLKKSPPSKETKPKLEKLEQKLQRIQEEARQSTIEISVFRAASFEKYNQGSKANAWISLLI